MTPDRLTVAICTWNRADLLRVTLDGLTRQELPAGLVWEVLVADNNSTDHTAAVVREFDCRLPVRYLFEGRQGKSHALNRVLDEAAADWVVFTDDDVRLPAGWLAAYLRAMAAAGPEVAFLGGPVRPWFETPPDPALAEALPEVRGGFCAVPVPAELEIRPDGVLPVGANVAVHRRRLGDRRFDPRLGPNRGGRIIGEEHALFQAVLADGRRGQWVPDAGLDHYVIPARLRPGHLCRTLFDLGRMNVLRNGRPAGRRVAGVPVWAVSQMFGAAARAGLDRVRGRRVDCYRQLATAVRRAGLAWQCFRGVPAHAS